MFGHFLNVLFSFFSCFWIPLNMAFLARLPMFCDLWCSVFGYKKPKLMTLRLNGSRISWLEFTTGNVFHFTHRLLCSHFFRRINACVLFSLSHFNAIYSIHGRSRETTKVTKGTRNGINRHFTVCVFLSHLLFLFTSIWFQFFCLYFTWRFGSSQIEIYIYIIWNTIASTRQVKLNFEHNWPSRYWLRQYPIGRKKSAKN